MQTVPVQPRAHTDDVPQENSIRNATQSDRAALTELHRRSSLIYEDNRAALLAHPELFGVSAESIKAGHIRVLTRSGQIVGFATLIPRAPGVGELEDLFVDPDYTHQGLGRMLVADAVARAPAMGIKRVEVTANPNATAFYEKVGFVVTGRSDTQLGPGWRMHRSV